LAVANAADFQRPVADRSIGVDAAAALCHYPEIDFAAIILFG
jgi:hypothetical protein